MLSVVKVGGSVLRDDASFDAVARFIDWRLGTRSDERLVVIVSAEYGATDALLEEAQAITAGAVGRRVGPAVVDRRAAIGGAALRCIFSASA